MQMGFFDLERRYASLSGLGDPLERLNATVDWEIFRSDLERIDQKVRKSAAGCKPTCLVLMFKLLILQRLYGSSDARLEYPIRGWFSDTRKWEARFRQEEGRGEWTYRLRRCV